MKVRLNSYYNRDELMIHELYIDEILKAHIHPLSETPEDAILERGLINGNHIIQYMKLAHEAGLKGEPLQLYYTNEP